MPDITNIDVSYYCHSVTTMMQKLAALPREHVRTTRPPRTIRHAAMFYADFIAKAVRMKASR